MSLYTASSNLFRPQAGRLNPVTEADDALVARSANVAHEIRSLITQRNYPCVAALSSFHQDDYQVGLYGRIGDRQHHARLRNDLLFFLQEQRRTNSVYLSFWAVFEPESLNEDDFELALWRELSNLTSLEQRTQDWGPDSISDPEDPEFRFSLEGNEFFVVGLHANSSRLGRKFAYPTLIFNVFEQFNELERQGQYEPMVKLNRQRDLKFQGSVNPMALVHGEKWESIQFSGKANGSEWKCPFRFLHQWAKK